MRGIASNRRKTEQRKLGKAVDAPQGPPRTYSSS